jgi:hypothetical protein
MMHVAEGSVGFFTVLDCLATSAVPLAQHPYANYVIQHALQVLAHTTPPPLPHLQIWSFNYTHQLMSAYSGWLVVLSSQKISSNVVEVLLEYSAGDLRRGFLEELLSEVAVYHMMLSPFGIFIAQKVLGVATDPEPYRFVMFTVFNKYYEHIGCDKVRRRWGQLVAGFEFSRSCVQSSFTVAHV